MCCGSACSAARENPSVPVQRAAGDQSLRDVDAARRANRRPSLIRTASKPHDDPPDRWIVLAGADMEAEACHQTHHGVIAGQYFSFHAL